jgi:DNA-binding transcriptional LysR family regulator
LQNGLKLTPAGHIVVAYAEKTLRECEQMVAMAQAVHRNQVPPLRIGFSSFIDAKLLETHLLHHILGSDGLSVCCGFENGVVTRFLSLCAELKIDSACT